jgi:beta-N-acetylhexosaminidase
MKPWLRRDHLLRGASIIVTAVVLLWCLHRRNPHLLSIRAYETTLLVALAAGATLLTWKLPGRFWRIALCMVNLGVMGYVLVDDRRFARLREQLLTNPPAAAQAINARLIVGFDRDEQAEALARHGIAGLFIARKNIQGLSFAQVQSKLAHLQEVRRSTGQAPLILAADQEGGVVSRLSPPLAARPALSTLAFRQDGEQLAYTYGREQGRELHELGITVNFSPVVDLLPQGPPSSLDRHTKIGQRAIAADPLEVTRIAGAYVRGLEESGVIAVLKHFPGLQKVPADTHHFSAELAIPPATLMHSDWLPFREIAANSRAWIMVAHVRLTTVDANEPASMSRTVIDQLLRKELSLHNPLVTDDLTMGAAYNRGFCRSINAAYATSMDYLLISFDSDKYVDAVQCLMQQQNGRPK